MITPNEVEQSPKVDTSLEKFLDEMLVRNKFTFTKDELLKYTLNKDLYTPTLKAYEAAGWVVSERSNGAYGPMEQMIVTFKKKD